MNYLNKMRVDEFEIWVGKLQTLKAMELGVGKSLLDVGCGIGYFTPTFLNKFTRVVGLDPLEKYLKVARKVNDKVEYVIGSGETFSLDEKFDTININMVLEHARNPVALLKNCKKHLTKDGMILAHVPNANSVTRRLGVLMGIIDSIQNITDKERNHFGHQRIYTIDSLQADVVSAGLRVRKVGGILFKPLPNEILGKICKEKGHIWTQKFMDALVEFGTDRPDDCAVLYVVCG